MDVFPLQETKAPAAFPVSAADSSSLHDVDCLVAVKEFASSSSSTATSSL